MYFLWSVWISQNKYITAQKYEEYICERGEFSGEQSEMKHRHWAKEIWENEQNSDDAGGCENFNPMAII